MSIPEVDSRNRLIAFLKRFFTEKGGTASFTDLTVTDDLTLGNEIIHAGNTNTKIGFGTNLQTFTCGGSTRMQMNSNGVGLMGASPIAGLAVTGDIETSGDIDIASGQYLRTNGIAAVGSSGNAVHIGSAATSKTLELYSDAGAALTIDAVGNVTTPYQPMVYAFRNSTQDLNPNTSWETVVFNDDSTTNDTAFDVGTDYNTGTGYFTAPADGKYLIAVEVMLQGVPTTTSNNQYILLNLITTKATADGANQYAGRRNPKEILTAETDFYQVAGTWLANMADGDTAYVQVRVTNADSGTKIYGASSTYTRIQIMKVA